MDWLQTDKPLLSIIEFDNKHIAVPWELFAELNLAGIVLIARPASRILKNIEMDSSRARPISTFDQIKQWQDLENATAKEYAERLNVPFATADSEINFSHVIDEILYLSQ